MGRVKRIQPHLTTSAQGLGEQLLLVAAKMQQERVEAVVVWRLHLHRGVMLQYSLPLRLRQCHPVEVYVVAVLKELHLLWQVSC